ncbi:MAG: formylglycine-generating enzyme family protein [Planctomycetes bacterium]|nr:formylglycine-generating enzyme family protein [Planctomycetota bacterium]
MRYLLLVVLLIGSSGVHLLAEQPKSIRNSAGMKLILIPAGQFKMGSPKKREGVPDETQHDVIISKPFYIGAFEVTQGEWKKMMGSNPSYFQGDKLTARRVQSGRPLKIDSGRYPVESISWTDAVEFCKKLSEMEAEKKAGRVYRLPTEAEWEYACRAGSQHDYAFGEKPETLPKNEWVQSNSEGQAHPVGEKKANAWGLFDVHGNVREWCEDLLDVYPTQEVKDPRGPKANLSGNRVNRGGSWNDAPAMCRVALRSSALPDDRNNRIGLRIVADATEGDSPTTETKADEK